jgi:hypothetical protein
MTPSSRSAAPQSLAELAATLGQERDTLFLAAAALQLVPENATKWVRFERLLEVAFAIPSGGSQRPVPASRLRQLLTKPPLATAQVTSGEDPFEECFTAEVSFHGGSHRVVLGGVSAAHAGCQLILGAVRGLSDEANHDYKQMIIGEATVLLTLSNVMCHRAGLRRWEVPPLLPRGPLVIPPPQELRRLATSASFTQEELGHLLGASLAHVGNLLAPGPMTLIDHEHESPTDDRIYLWPLVELSDGTVVVSLPGGLAASLTHRALVAAVDANMTDELVEALHETLQASAQRSLQRVRWQRIPAPISLAPPSLVRESFYQLDLDKVAHVVSIVDRLDGYVAGRPFESTDFRAVEDEIHERFLAVRSAIRGKSDQTSVLHVTCTGSLGRNFFLGFTDEATDDRSALLNLTADDLDLMTRLEAPDPLGLWKFAVASTRLHERSRVLSFSKLDEYAIYRGHSNGFYLSDDRPPTMLTIPPGSAGDLRTAERRRLDQHAVPLPDDNLVVEVIRWPAEDSVPIYRPDHPRYRELHLVEITGPCWVVPTPETSDETGLSEDLAEAIAFWLWKCQDFITEPLARIFESHPSLIVRVRFATQSPDAQADVADIEPVSTWLGWDVQPGQGQVRLTLEDGAALRLRGPGNDAERAVAGVLVEAVHQLAGLDRSGLQDEVVAALPAGPMKMLQVLAAEDDLLLALGHTAAPRLIPSADIEETLDEVGHIAREGLALQQGPVSTGDRTDVLNGIVLELFTQLGQQLQHLSPDGLLENLVAEQEALEFLQARNRFLIPSQVACFGDDSSAVRRAIEASQNLTTTALASRFIIEGVTAVPPSGDKELSVGTLDHLLAIAREIVELGYLSDAIRYGLSSTELSVLPSGRLGSSRDEPYHQMLLAYVEIMAGRSVQDAREQFARHWRSPETKDPFDPSELNDAYEAEFGVSATDMSHVVGDLIDIARDEDRHVAVRPLEDLVGILGERLQWKGNRVRLALDMLILGPLEEFPPPANRADSYPWRFSRNRSAARRPLLLRDDPNRGAEAVWGPRCAYRSGLYLLEQVSSGRLNAQSDRMRKYMTSARQVANRQFNRDVAALYRDKGFERVHENVKRFGKLRLERVAGEDIGDIDVLVISQSAKVLLAIEVKDFEFARTPFELSNEVEKLLSGPDSAAHHHEERLSFLKANLEDIAAELNLLAPVTEWQVQGEIVTSADLMAAHFPAVEALRKRLNIVSYAAIAAVDPQRLITKRGSTRPSRSGHKRKSKRNR